jgi:hypothetical protein
MTTYIITYNSAEIKRFFLFSCRAISDCHELAIDAFLQFVFARTVWAEFGRGLPGVLSPPPFPPSTLSTNILENWHLIIIHVTNLTRNSQSVFETQIIFKMLNENLNP